MRRVTKKDKRLRLVRYLVAAIVKEVKNGEHWSDLPLVGPNDSRAVTTEVINDLIDVIKHDGKTIRNLAAQIALKDSQDQRAAHGLEFCPPGAKTKVLKAVK